MHDTLEALESLLPVSAHGSKDNLKSLSTVWSWYLLSRPSILRHTLHTSKTHLSSSVLQQDFEILLLGLGSPPLVYHLILQDKQTGAERVLARMKKGLLGLTGAERSVAELGYRAGSDLPRR